MLIKMSTTIMHTSEVEIDSHANPTIITITIMELTWNFLL